MVILIPIFRHILSSPQTKTILITLIHGYHQIIHLYHSYCLSITLSVYIPNISPIIINSFLIIPFVSNSMKNSLASQAFLLLPHDGRISVIFIACECSRYLLFFCVCLFHVWNFSKTSIIFWIVLPRAIHLSASGRYIFSNYYCWEGWVLILVIVFVLHMFFISSSHCRSCC